MANKIIKIINIDKRNNLFYILFSIIYSLLGVIGNSYHIDNTLNHIFDKNLPTNTLLFILLFIIYFAISKFIFNFLTIKSSSITSTKFKKIFKLYNTYEFRIVPILLLLFYLPGLIIIFKAVADWDTWQTIYELTIDEVAITAHHPIAFHMMLLFFINLSKIFNDATLGLYFNTVFIFLIYIVVLTYSFYLMKAIKLPVKIRIMMLALYLISPLYSNYSFALLKDPIYSIFTLLLVIELIFILKSENKNILIHYCLLFLSVCCVSVFRNNGKYILIVMVLATLCYNLFTHFSFSNIKNIFIITAVGLILSVSTITIISNVNKWKPASIREMLSVPVQQMGRYCQYYSDKLTDEDIKNINKLSNIDNFKNKYNPLLSDPLKNSLVKSSSFSDYIDFTKVYIKCITMHPGTAFSAVLNQNYILFTPLFDNYFVYTMYEPPKAYSILTDNGYFDKEPAFPVLRISLNKYYNTLYKFPIIKIFFNPFLYVFLTILSLFIAFLHKKINTLLLLIVPFFSLIIIFLGPAVYNYTRYTLPIVYTIPLIIFYLKYQFER